MQDNGIPIAAKGTFGAATRRRRAANRSRDGLSPGLLHTDPAPDAFRWNPARAVCGLIDWSVATAGPLLYDLASAVMYVGGPAAARPLVDA